MFPDAVDETAQEPILRSMTLGHIDYYVHKPERSGDEHFHRFISECKLDLMRCRSLLQGEEAF